MNLKAKRKSDGKIVDVEKIYGFSIYSIGEDEFNTLYEVTSDTQEGWREEYLEWYYKTETSQEEKITPKQELDYWINKAQEAYKQGQADAYRESAKLAIDNKKSVLDLYPTADIHTPTEKLAIQVTAKNEYNNACEYISLAIEQLSSNKE